MSCSTYGEALLGARQMDIMTIMLGTNDGDRFLSANGEWTAADDAQFIASCEKLVKSFYDKNNNLKFFLFKSPHCFRLDSNYVAGLPSVWKAQEAAYDALKNKGYDMLGFLDVAAITKDMGLYFSDGLHPSDPGHKMMAEKIAEYLQGELLGK
jgi:lysophospholipase L1-like esterase